ncbi:MAG: GNAT family N-acetyltransferase [Bacteroidetes bacterium]|nr:GNAT family N-acetyltransferase [Bacteroidota bacterium]
MIRKHNPEDIEVILDIWYKASTLAHPFLETSYVEKVKKDMKNLYIPNSQTWIYEEKNTVIGFISMLENEIGGLFVLPNYHSKGIGTQLVNFIRAFHDELEVEVFEKNIIGRTFYDKLGFKLMHRSTHSESDNEVLRLKIKC